MKRVLITGGAGFIGSHLADELLAQGYFVRVLDSLIEQVHGPGQGRPGYLDREVELTVGDVTDREAVDRALEGVDAVFHLAARVGVGQSMYRIEDYTATNNLGTAVLLECLAERPVERLVVASSMSIYGEGLYRSPDGRLVDGVSRGRRQLEARRWEVLDQDSEALSPARGSRRRCRGAGHPRIFDDLSRPGVEANLEWLLATHGDRIEPVVGDVRNAEAVSQAVAGTSAVFHFAAQVAVTTSLDDPAADFDVNARGTLHVLDGMQVRDVLFVEDLVDAMLAAHRRIESTAGQAFNVGGGPATGWRPTTPVAEGVARLYQWLADEVAGPIPAALAGTGLSRPSAAVAVEGGAA